MPGKKLISGICFVGLSLWAGDSALDRGTLRGVRAINVVIDPLGTQLEGNGLSRDMLRARIEARLQQAGIAVDPKAVEFLGLRVDSVLARKGPQGLCLSLGFYQRVVLARDQSIRTATQTWDVSTMLLVAPKPMMEAALNTAEQLADQFVIAYQSANPR